MQGCCQGLELSGRGKHKCCEILKGTREICWFTISWYIALCFLSWGRMIRRMSQWHWQGVSKCGWAYLLSLLFFCIRRQSETWHMLLEPSQGLFERQGPLPSPEPAYEDSIWTVTRQAQEVCLCKVVLIGALSTWQTSSDNRAELFKCWCQCDRFDDVIFITLLFVRSYARSLISRQASFPAYKTETATFLLRKAFLHCYCRLLQKYAHFSTSTYSGASETWYWSPSVKIISNSKL